MPVSCQEPVVHWNIFFHKVVFHQNLSVLESFLFLLQKCVGESSVSSVPLCHYLTQVALKSVLNISLFVGHFGCHLITTGFSRDV